VNLQVHFLAIWLDRRPFFFPILTKLRAKIDFPQFVLDLIVRADEKLAAFAELESACSQRTSFAKSSTER
jgi:hypothetical protein